jgi:SAM-dependent methyltransferase
MFYARSGKPLPLPPVGLRFMGEDDNRLIAVGDELAELLVAYGLTAEASILDVGCGYGRLALGLLHATGHRGRYLGFDILRRQIDWCRASISPAFPSLRFEHFDIRNERYNPGGMIEPTEASFPARSARTDVCALFSVFTHLYRPDIERYLDEIRRVLRPGGVAITTWLLFDEARLPHVTASSALYPMVHVLDEVTRYSEEGNPLRAIAYEEEAVRGMIRNARLEVLTVDRGTWAGEPGRTAQDLVVLRRSAADTTVDPEPAGPGVVALAATAGRDAIRGIRKLARRARGLARRAVRRG